MADRIKGITVEIGGDTTGLNKALAGTNKSIKNTQTQLKDVERLLKLDPKNTELMRQKQELLAKAVKETEGKLQELNKANEQVSKTVKNYDAWKAAYDPIQAEIDITSQKLKDLRERQKEMKELGQVDTEEYQKLQQEIKETTGELKGLKEEAKRVTEEFGNPISDDQYKALKREIIDTEMSLRDLKAEAGKVDDALYGVDEKPVEDVANAAEDAEKSLREAGKEASHFGDYLKAEMLVEGAKGIVSSLRDVAEETKEYQKIMGSLEVSSERAGYTAEETRKIYQQLYGILGDDQTAATTTANLQALGFEQEKLQKIMEASVGAWATYGDSIPIDGLAEAINETAKVGTVTGTLADVLNWAGVSEDEFNARLEGIGDAAGRADEILKQLSSQGLVEAGQAWRENNAALYESNQAQAEYQEQLVQLGEIVQPVITDILQMVTGLLEKFNSLDEGTKKMILGIVALVAALGPVIAAFSGVSNIMSVISGGTLNLLTSGFQFLTKTVLPAVGSGFSSVFSFIISNPVALLIAAIVGLVLLIGTKGDEIQAILQKVDDFMQNIFARDWTEVFGPVLGTVLNEFFRNVKGIWDACMRIFNGVIDFIRGVFTGDWERAWSGVKEIFAGIFGGLVSLAKSPLNGVIGLLNGAIGAVNSLIRGFNRLGFDMPKWLGGGSWHPNLPSISKIPYLAKGGSLYQGSAVVGEAGPELLTMMGNRAVVQPLTNQDTKNNYLGGITLNVYGAPGQDEGKLADLVAEKLEDLVQREERAFA